MNGEFLNSSKFHKAGFWSCTRVLLCSSECNAIGEDVFLAQQNDNEFLEFLEVSISSDQNCYPLKAIVVT